MYLSNFVLFRAMEIIYEKTKGRIPVRPSLAKQNDLNQVVESSGFSENKGLCWVLNLSAQKVIFVLVILIEGFSKKKRPFGSSKKNLTFKARLSAKHLLIGQLHDDVILLQLQESLSLLFSCANWGYFSLILSGIDKFK